jgi:hypothetical protein
VSWVKVVEGVKNRPVDVNLLELSRCSNVKEEGAPLLLSYCARRGVADWCYIFVACGCHAVSMQERVDVAFVYLYYYIVIWQ